MEETSGRDTSFFSKIDRVTKPYKQEKGETSKWTKKVITSENELKSGGSYGKWHFHYSKGSDNKSCKGAEMLRIPNKESYLCRYDKNAKTVTSKMEKIQ